MSTLGQGLLSCRSAVLVLWLAMLVVAFQGSRGLWDPDEGRYVSVALRMLDSGDFLVPHIDAEHPHLTKPPLTYWLLAGSFALLGRNEWAARAPNALAFVLTGLVVAWLARLLGRSAPWRAAFVWSTTLMPFVAANIVTTDTLLALFEALIAAGYLLAIRPQGSAMDLRGVWLLWLAAALAFLTKGPPGLLPLAAIFGHAWVTRGRAARALFGLWPTLAFLLVASAWFVYLAEHAPRVWRYFVEYEFVDRIATDVHGRNPGWHGLFVAYAPVLAIGTLPWLVPAICSRWLARRRDALPRSRAASAAWRSDFLLWWLFVPLAMFVAAQSRLALYLLPLFVPFALWVAAAIEERATRHRLRFLAIGILAALALLALKLFAAHWESPRDARARATEMRRSVDLAAFEEIVFVNQPVPHGLALYIPNEIEGAGILRAADAYAAIPGKHGICDEIAERPSTLFVIAPEFVRAARQAAIACGYGPLAHAGWLRGSELLTGGGY